MRNLQITIIFLILLFGSIPVGFMDTIPTIDGVVADGEWEDAAKYNIELTNGQNVDFRTYYTTTDMYFAITLPHNGPKDVINLEPQVDGVGQFHDYFGIEFDINFDGAIMGTSSSPDDLMVIDYDVPGYKDMYMHNYKVFEDTINGGTNDGEGKSGTDGVNLTWEFRKPLNSNDKNGYDISLIRDQEFRIMLAFWDDRPIHTAAGYTNTYQENSLFIPFFVGQVKQKFTPNFVSIVFLFIAFARTIQLNRPELLRK